MIQSKREEEGEESEEEDNHISPQVKLEEGCRYSVDSHPLYQASYCSKEGREVPLFLVISLSLTSSFSLSLQLLLTRLRLRARWT